VQFVAVWRLQLKLGKSNILYDTNCKPRTHGLCTAYAWHGNHRYLGPFTRRGPTQSPVAAFCQQQLPSSACLQTADCWQPNISSRQFADMEWPPGRWLQQNYWPHFVPAEDTPVQEVCSADPYLVRSLMLQCCVCTECIVPKSYYRQPTGSRILRNQLVSNWMTLTFLKGHSGQCQPLHHIRNQCQSQIFRVAKTSQTVAKSTITWYRNVNYNVRKWLVKQECI